MYVKYCPYRARQYHVRFQQHAFQHLLRHAGKARPHFFIPGQPFSQTIQSLSKFITGKICQRLGAFIHLNARHYSLCGQQSRQRHTRLITLIQCFLEQNHR